MVADGYLSGDEGNGQGAKRPLGDGEQPRRKRALIEFKLRAVGVEFDTEKIQASMEDGEDACRQLRGLAVHRAIVYGSFPIKVALPAGCSPSAPESTVTFKEAVPEPTAAARPASTPASKPSAKAAKTPGSAKAAKTPGSAKTAKTPGSAKTAKTPGSAKATSTPAGCEGASESGRDSEGCMKPPPTELKPSALATTADAAAAVAESQQHGAALASIGSPKDQNTAHQAGTSPTSSDAQCAKRPVPAGAEDAECVVTKVSKHSVTASPGKESRDAKKDSEPKAQKTKKKITPTVVAPEAAPKRITPIIVCDDADDTDAAKAQASKKAAKPQQKSLMSFFSKAGSKA